MSKKGLGPWPESYGVGMKVAPPRPPAAYDWNGEPHRDWAEQALLDMAKRRRDVGPPVHPYEYFEEIGRRHAQAATVKAGVFLGAAYLGAFVIWGTSWL